jgi:hypothetical protein
VERIACSKILRHSEFKKTECMSVASALEERQGLEKTWPMGLVNDFQSIFFVF